MNFRPTHALIDLKALQHNYQEVQKRLPKNSSILCMVKADAYGHGAIPIAKVFESLGVACLGVATIEEGVELRQAGIKTKILIMGGLSGQGEEAAKALLTHCLTPVVHSAGVVDLLNQTTHDPIWVHLKIDTGMTRLGVTPEALPQVLQTLQKNPQVKLEGVMTHLAFRQDEEFTKAQIQLFKEMGEIIQKTLGKIPVWHVANSAAVMDGSPIEFEWASQYWARPGIMLYGIPPYPEYKNRAELKPVMSLVSQIVLIKNVKAGTKVSYNCTFTTKRASRIGVIPIGYADGYPWGASNKAKVLVEGMRLPILGRVTMDMIMVDLTDCRDAKVGSEVVLLGKQGDNEISADALAAWGSTFAYEIVCRVSKRMPRVYQK